tara:strand:+ start:3659 stop:4132 length:474 start_codon:yes stop_codon:yes gene_type:complete
MFVLDDFLTDFQIQKIYNRNLPYDHTLYPKEELECFYPFFDEAKKHFDFSECIGYEVWRQRNPQNLGWHYDHDEILLQTEDVFSWPICTIVYYIRVCDILGGNLLFRDGTSIKPLQNRLVIFGPGIEHAVDEMFTVDGHRDSILINPWTYEIKNPVG